MPIVGSPGASLQPYPEISLSDLFHAAARRWSERVAFVDAVTGTEISYTRLAESASGLGANLVDGGVAPGDRVALVAPNSVEWVVTFLGAVSAGATVTTLDPTGRRREIEHQLNDSQPVLVFASESVIDQVAGAWTGDVQPIETVWDLTGRSPDRAGRPRPDPRTGICVLPYSSGTTGLPKGVMLTHRNLVANAHQLLAPGPVTAQSVMIDFLPFFHIYGMVGLMTIGIVAGARQIVLPGFDRELFARAVRDHRATNLFVVPPVLRELSTELEADWTSVTHIQTAGAPVPPGLVERVAHRCGATVYEGYGLTEASPATNSSLMGPSRSGTVGPPLPDTRERVVDTATGADLAFGSVGELLVSGPQVMAGYLGDRDATEAAIMTDGSGRWLRTGDIVSMDGDGYVTVHDRAKEMIKFRAHQIAPAELEAVLLEHPAVTDAAVVGRAVDRGDGEIPRAYVVLAADAVMTATEVIDHVAARVAPHKRVREVEFVTEVPRSPTGKILRRALQ